MSLFDSNLSGKLARLSQWQQAGMTRDLPAPAASQPTTIAPGSAGKTKRSRPKKLLAPVGPYHTTRTTFERGKQREIVIERVTPAAIVYRLIGLDGEYTLPHDVAFQKALSIFVDFDTGPRAGKIRRGL